jgi:hypothetical protein
MTRAGDRRARRWRAFARAGRALPRGLARTRPRTASWCSSRRPGRPWLPNAIALGPGPTVVWDPFVARIEPGPALAAREQRDPARAGRSREPPGRGRPLGGGATRLAARRPSRGFSPRCAQADVAARASRRRSALWAAAPGLTPEGDDLLAGARPRPPPRRATDCAPARPARAYDAACRRRCSELPRRGRAARSRCTRCWTVGERLARRRARARRARRSSGRAMALGVGAGAARARRRGTRAHPPRMRDTSSMSTS